MVEATTIVRSLHIFSAILWAGGALYFQAIAKNAMKSKGVLMEFLANSKHGPFMGVTALATVAFGIGTWTMMGPESYTSTANMILGMGALGATIGLLVGFGGHLPNGLRAKAAIASNDDEAVGTIARRELLLDRISMAAVGLALLSMVTFRWF